MITCPLNRGGNNQLCDRGCKFMEAKRYEP